MTYKSSSFPAVLSSGQFLYARPLPDRSHLPAVVDEEEDLELFGQAAVQQAVGLQEQVMHVGLRRKLSLTVPPLHLTKTHDYKLLNISRKL